MTSSYSKKPSLWLYFATGLALLVLGSVVFAELTLVRLNDAFSRLASKQLSSQLESLSLRLKESEVSQSFHISDFCRLFAHNEMGVKLQKITEDVEGEIVCSKVAEELAREESQFHNVSQLVLLSTENKLKLTLYGKKSLTDEELKSFQLPILFGGILLLVITLGFGYLFYLQVGPPLTDMRIVSQKLSTGKFDTKLPDYHILEIAKLATSMNKMGSQLKHLEEVRRDFVANVSHELKTPITSIKGFVETLLDGAMENPQERKKFLEIIKQQGERLTLIVEDLLTLSQLESTRTKDFGMFQPTELAEVLTEVASILSTQAKSKNITIDITSEPGLTAKLDRSLFEQAVGNLLVNAIKYSGPNTRISLISRAEDCFAVVEVIDQGPGIAAEHLPRIFERFYRVDRARSRKIGGTGLGLAIVKHIANIHSGTAGVSSVVGQGSNFFIRIPITDFS